MELQERLKQKFTTLFGYLDERQRRIAAAVEARSLGRGGITAVAAATGMSRRPSIHKGLGELTQRKPRVPLGRTRKPGAGRKPLAQSDPRILEELDRLVDPDTRGDPMSPLRWTCKSTRQLADALGDAGHPVSHRVVGELLASMGCSLQANVKTRERSGHPERDAQFRYLNDQVRRQLAQQWPVISVDTKKKELIGDYKNGGVEWQPKGDPSPFRFTILARRKGFHMGSTMWGKISAGSRWDATTIRPASPSPVYAAGGWPWVAVSIRRHRSFSSVPMAAVVTATDCDCGKVELQQFADETGLTVTVCHLPPGTSKWNKIEHRLFSHISMNWRGRPLTSYEVVVELIASTTTRTGLRVRAELDHELYPTGTEVTDDQIEALSLRRHSFHGEWNYDISPRPAVL